MSDKVYSGGYRMTVLVVNKKDAALNNMPGYPVGYQFLNQFTHGGVTYPELESLELAELDAQSYETRLAAFYAYVDLQNTGVDSAGYDYAPQEGPTGTNHVLCPVGVHPPSTE